MLGGATRRFTASNLSNFEPLRAPTQMCGTQPVQMNRWFCLDMVKVQTPSSIEQACQTANNACKPLTGTS